MKIEIDNDLKDVITEKWITTVLSPVDKKLLEGLTIKIIEPTKNWDQSILSESKLIDLENEAVKKELGKRLHGGFCNGWKSIEVYIVKKAWDAYYSYRRDIAKNLFHEICHANDQEDMPTTITLVSPGGYATHPREIRARTYAEEMMNRLEGKRKLFKVVR